MGHKPGSKDKKPRTRRPATVAEKEQRAKKKQKQSHSDHQRAKANFFTSMARPSPQDQGDGTGTNPNQNEPETHFEEINAQDANGTTDLGEIIAALDDEYDGEANDEKTSVMMEYMKAIMRRYQDEDSPTFQQRERNGHVWLKEFLKHHKSHIRAECAEMICRKLCIEYHDEAYYRDI
jgi:hypothetical protein